MPCSITATIIATLLVIANTQHLLAQSSQKTSKGSPTHLQAAADQIDQHIADLFKKQNLSTPETLTDEKFLRRTSLVIVGRIPTIAETTAFLESTSPNKRQLLTTYYLNTPGYQSSMTNWMFDLLRVQENFSQRGASASAYIEFLRHSISYNKSYKTLVNELITAEGSIWKNGAVGYYIRDKGMPLDNTANTMRTFLGTRMECAQCHDHPFEDWERRDFFRLAAFTNKQPEINGQIYRDLSNQLNDPEKRRTPEYRLLQQIGDSIYHTSLAGQGAGRIKLPNDYQYRNGHPGEYIGARTPFAKTIRMSDRRDADDGRETFAQWITSPDNPRFASIITNRMWKRVLGTGLYEPVDEYLDPEKTASPALTKFAIKLMQDLDFDLQKFQHALLLTRTYAFVTSTKINDPSKSYNQHGRQLNRMSAEQIWDSLITLTVKNPDELPTRHASNAIRINGKTLYPGKMNMAQLSDKILAAKSSKELKKILDQLLADSKDTSKNKNSAPMMSANSRPGPASGIARASELPTPAPAGHFLRDFGQSDRVLVDSSTREPNVSQVLNILNGHVEKMIISNPDAAIHGTLNTVSSSKDKIRLLFLATLTRQPTELELSVMETEVKQSGDKGYQNILSALLLSREFLYIQ